MKLCLRITQRIRLATCLTLLLIAIPLAAQPQLPQSSGPGFIVTYVEAVPANAAALAADLTAYARQVESQPARPRVTLLREAGRPNRMVVIEQWPDVASPAIMEAGTLLLAKAQPDAQAPVDRRVNHPMAGAIDAALNPDKAPIFVVLMHVDIGRDAAADAPKIVLAQRDSVLAAPGALAYEVAVQDQKANHFALCEVWKSRAAYEAYTGTGPGEDFRRRLATLIGSPFDDRFYEIVSH